MQTFTKAVYAKYLCDKCKSAYYERRDIPISPIINGSHIVEHMLDESPDESKNICKKCRGKGGVHLIALECIPEPYMVDEYGDVGRGKWVCPEGANHIPPVYPGRLKRFKNGYDKDALDAVRYKTIVKDGPPWRCPECNALLAYMEDRCYGMGGRNYYT
jgi:hypothetical protein